MAVDVELGVDVDVAVGVDVAVDVEVGVDVAVDVEVGVDVAVGVGNGTQVSGKFVQVPVYNAKSLMPTTKSASRSQPAHAGMPPHKGDAVPRHMP